jgi:hypothetical protein
MLWKMQNLGVVSKSFEVLFRLAIFELTHLGLREAKPAPKKLLIESFAKKLEMTRVVPIRLENLPYVLARKSGAKLISLEELISELRGWSAELVTLLPVTSTAQASGVVGRERRSATCAAAAVARYSASQATGSAHLNPPPRS